MNIYKNIGLSIIVFFLSIHSTFGNEHIDKLIAKGDSLLFQKRFNEARDLYIQAQRTAVDASDHYLKHLCQYKEAYSYLPEDNHAKALSILTNVQLELSPQCKEDSALLFLVEREIDVLDYQCIHPEYEISIIEKEYVKMLPFLSNEQHRSRATYLMGRIHQIRAELPQAIDYFETLLNKEIKSNYLWERLHFYLLLAVYETGDYRKGLDIMEKVGNKEFWYYKNIFFDSFNAHLNFRLRNFSEALKIYNHIIEENSADTAVGSLIQDAYTASALCNLRLGDTLESNRLYRLSESMNRPERRTEGIIFLYGRWSHNYLIKGQYIEALNLLNKGELIIKNFDVKPSQRYYLFNKKAGVMQLMGDTISSINYIDSIINAVSAKDQEAWLPVDWSYYNYLLRNHNFVKRVVFYDHNMDSTGLHQLHKQFGEILGISQYLYEQAESIEMKYSVQFQLRMDFENLFLSALLLYKATQNESYLQEMLEYIDRGKAIQFKSGLVHNELLANKTVPEELTAKERQLKLYLEQMRFLIRSDSEVKLHEDKRRELAAELPYAQYRYDSIKELISSNNIQIEEQTRWYSIEKVQRVIDQDQLVLNYFISEERLFVFLISKEFIDFQEVPLSQNIQELSNDFYNILQKYSPSEDTKKQFLVFKEKSSALYNYLIKPFESHIVGKRLVIVPDLELGLFSYDALIANNIGVTFSDLNYLVKSNPVAEVYSLKQLDYRSDKLNRHSKFIGFAPSYSEYDRAKYQPLAAATEEVQQIGAYFSGVSYEGEFATKKRFLDEARKYDIVHLALHTKLNELQPQYSQLLFSEKDNPLSIYELYGDRFKTKLIVLGGCNTGKGIVRYGEGVTNLARDFFFTGVKNVILAKWEISDKSSANLMNGFYRSLHDKNPVDVALQKAKVDYLVNVDPLKSHPYYWAGFTTVGKPVHVSSTSKDLHYIAGGFILLSLVLVAIRRSKV